MSSGRAVPVCSQCLPVRSEFKPRITAIIVCGFVQYMPNPLHLTQVRFASSGLPVVEQVHICP